MQLQRKKIKTNTQKCGWNVCSVQLSNYYNNYVTANGKLKCFQNQIFHIPKYIYAHIHDEIDKRIGCKPENERQLYKLRFLGHT